MIYLLILFTIIILAYRRALKLTTIHIDVFLISTLYYYLSQFVIFDNDLFYNEESMVSWRETMNELYTTHQVNSILLYISAMFLSFSAGSILGAKISLTKKNIILSANGIKLITPAAFFIIFFALFKTRAHWFLGYNGGSSPEGNAMLSGAVMITSLLILFRLMQESYTFNKFWGILSLYLIGSIFLMGMGMRLYVITTLVSMIFLNFIKKNGKIDFFKYSSYIFLAVVTLIIIGAWRQGNDPYNNGSNFFNFFSEPIYTSYSWASFWSRNQNISAVNIGQNFIDGIINIVPNIILPKNLAFYNNNSNYSFFSPVGGLGNLFTLVANFGYIGCNIYLAFLGFLFRITHNATKYNNPYKAIYSYQCAILLFLFFRDTFTVVYKVQILVGMIIPIMIFLLFRAPENKKENDLHLGEK